MHRSPDRPRVTPAKLSVRERVVMRWAAAVFLAIILDGAARKWLLPQNLQAIPYFAKDVLAGLFLLAYPQPREARWANRLWPFALGIGVCLAPAFLLGLAKAPVGAIVVLKNAVLWPLFAIRLATYLTDGIIERLWRFTLACSIPMAALSSVQYFSVQGSILNRYAWGDITSLGSIARAGEFVRATGTFSYITGLASFSIVMFCIFLGRSLSSQSGDFWRAMVGIASAVICGLTTGSRGVQTTMAAAAVIVITFVPKKQSVRVVGGIIGAGIVIALLWNSSLAQGVLARWGGTQSGEVGERLGGLGQPISETLLANPMGLGLGLYTGISAATGMSADLAYNEGPLNKISAETGILGLAAAFLTLAMIIRVALWTLAGHDASRKSRLLPLAAGALIQVAQGLWYDHVSTALWWWAIALWFGGAFNINLAKRSRLVRQSVSSTPVSRYEHQGLPSVRESQ